MFKNRNNRNQWLSRYHFHSKDGGNGQEGGGGADSESSEEAAIEGQVLAIETEGTSEEVAKLVKENMKKKSQIADLTASVESMKDQATAFDTAKNELTSLTAALGGLSPEDIAGLVKQQKDDQLRSLEEKGEYDTIIDGMKTSHQSTVDQLTSQHVSSVEALTVERDQLAEEKASLGSKIEELTIGRQFAESPFIREKSILPPTISRQTFGTNFDFDGDAVVAYDKPRGQEGRAPLVDANNNNLSFEAAIDRLYSSHQDASSLIRSQQKPGAGSKTTEGSGNQTEAIDEQLSGLDRISAGLTKLSRV